jgi:speckle-type POZ protein
MQHLLVAADRYGLERLKLRCEEELCKKFDSKTITTTLKLADPHHCKRLKDACLEFLSNGRRQLRPRV